MVTVTCHLTTLIPLRLRLLLNSGGKPWSAVEVHQNICITTTNHQRLMWLKMVDQQFKQQYHHWSTINEQWSIQHLEPSIIGFVSFDPFTTPLSPHQQLGLLGVIAYILREVAKVGCHMGEVLLTVVVSVSRWTWIIYIHLIIHDLDHIVLNKLK